MYDNTLAKALCKNKGHKFEFLNSFLYARTGGTWSEGFSF